MNIDESVAGSSLGARLQTSLDSKAEHKLFEYYFRQFKPKLKERLPALIPQVYLHYDPVSIKELRLRHPQERKRFPRQRMDFLLLLAGGARIVLEVDGKHHFSTDNNEPSLDVYAEMVAADRDLSTYVVKFSSFWQENL
jgi:hypothetical protein